MYTFFFHSVHITFPSKQLSLEHSNSREAKDRSATQDTPHLSRNPKVHNCIHYKPTMDPIVSQMNAANFNIIISKLKSSNFFPFVFSALSTDAVMC